MINLHFVAYQPDIAANLGSLVRLSACLGMKLHVVEPCGFPLDEKRMRRSAMDYAQLADIASYPSWEAFLQAIAGKGHRLVLLTTKGAQPYTEFSFQSGDMLLLGRESAGVPETVHERADARVFVPMQAGARSLNVVQSACMVAGEALRQTALFATTR